MSSPAACVPPVAAAASPAVRVMIRVCQGMGERDGGEERERKWYKEREKWSDTRADGVSLPSADTRLPLTKIETTDSSGEKCTLSPSSPFFVHKRASTLSRRTHHTSWTGCVCVCLKSFDDASISRRSIAVVHRNACQKNRHTQSMPWTAKRGG